MRRVVHDSPEQRRTRWRISVELKAAHGFTVENDPAFLEWIEQWIAGEANMGDVQQRYVALLRSRGETTVPAGDGTANSLKEIWQEVPETGSLDPRNVDQRSKRQGPCGRRRDRLNETQSRFSIIFS